MSGRRARDRNHRAGDAVPEGAVVARRFRVLKAVGKGGMSAVYAAEDLVTGHRVALKLLDVPDTHRAQMVERFRREAGVAKRLRGPNFAAIIDFGSDNGLEAGAGVHYIAMQLLTGETLQARLARVGTLSIEEALVLVDALEAGLTQAHKLGIIHRDLKPANVFYSRLPTEIGQGGDGAVSVPPREVIKIIDFGIARTDLFGGDRLTMAGNIVGSLHYMSPEQASAEPDVDQRSDLWQVGALLYRALSGQRPFEGPGGTVLARLVSEDVAPVCNKNPALPRALNGFFAQALARKRSDRFASIESLASAFRHATKSVSGTRPIVRVQPSFSSSPEIDFAAMRESRLSLLLADAAQAPSLDDPSREGVVADAEEDRPSQRPTQHEPLVEERAAPRAELPKPIVLAAPASKRALPSGEGARSRGADRLTSVLLVITMLCFVVIGVLVALLLGQ